MTWQSITRMKRATTGTNNIKQKEIMKNYQLKFDSGTIEAEKLRRLVSNSINFLAGASLAMEATGGSRLKVTFAEKSVILFQTDSENFIHLLRSKFNQHGAEISEFGFTEKPLQAIACQLPW